MRVTGTKRYDSTGGANGFQVALEAWHPLLLRNRYCVGALLVLHVGRVSFAVRHVVVRLVPGFGDRALNDLARYLVADSVDFFVRHVIGRSCRHGPGRQDERGGDP